MSLFRHCFAAVGLTLCCGSTILAQGQYGFINTKPSGQPYWKPQESVKSFKVPPGWEVKVFAAEPDIINPIAFTVDEKGRLWVVENFEYPNKTPKGKKPRDRIKVLEDTDGDGVADKVTLWADGKDLPTGWDLASAIEVGNGGVYLGAAPYLFFLQDTEGKGKCTKQDVLLKGFGSQDEHETLNTLQWGPDGKLYGLHGVFTSSNIDGVKLNAAVWRYDTGDKRFEVFAEGTSNPWGMDFDARGQCHLVCCVIPHLFHMVPGGTYERQAGVSFNPYAYGLLSHSCDHIHHKESGWAHAGLLVMEGSHVPDAYQGSVLMGSIHGCSIKRDTLRQNGSTFVASHAPDFLVSGDKNFRPINLRWGPDGSIYVIDWHDQNPCHQAPRDSWDKEHGRIYKIQRVGQKKTPPPDLSKKSSKELVELLANDNPWWYRTASRLLGERRDKSVVPAIEKMLFSSENEVLALRALWALYRIGGFNEDIAGRALEHQSPWVRAWAIRLLGEANHVSDKMLTRLTKLAQSEQAPEVRLQVASTAQRLKDQDVVPLLHNLMTHKKDSSDPFLPLMIWLAYEPRLVSKQTAALAWLKDNAPGNSLISGDIVPKAMRRLVATGKQAELEACLQFAGGVKESEVRRQALEGLLTALKGQKLNAPASWDDVLTTLLDDKDAKVNELAKKLAVHFQDPKAIQQALAVALNAALKTPKRIDAVQALATAGTPEVLDGLLKLVAAKSDDAVVRTEALRALGEFQDAKIPGAVLADWSSFTPPMKVEAVNLLSSRKPWAAALLTAVGQKKVERTDLNNNHILKINAFKDAKLNKQIEDVWGKLRDTPAELDKLIATMRAELDQGTGSAVKGKKMFETNCAKCHKFEGVGHDVGPNLDGAARDVEYLLVNILDPNRVVGQPYFTRLVQTKNGKIESGLLHAEDPNSITLKQENGKLTVILKKDIDGDIVVQSKSMMPEGLDKGMSMQDFRDLIRYLMADPFLTEVAVAGPHAKGMAPPAATTPAVPVSGKIVIAASTKKGEVAEVTAAVQAPKAMKTELKLGSKQPLRVWLNDILVYEGTPHKKEASPDQVVVPVSLQGGANSLRIEVTTDGGPAVLFARFADRDRQLTQKGQPCSSP